MKKFSLFIIILGLLYTGAWFGAAYFVKNTLASNEMENVQFSPAPSDITGFPGFPKLKYTGTITTPTYAITATDMTISGHAGLKKVNLALNFPKGFSLKHKITGTQKFNTSHIKLNAPYPLPISEKKADITAWQSSNGKVIVTSLLIQKDGVKVSGKKGVFGLDGNLQIAGTMDVSVNGYQKLLMQLGQSRHLPKEAGIAGALIGQFLGGGKKSSKQETSLDTTLNIKNRQVKVGPLKVTTLNKIKWKK